MKTVFPDIGILIIKMRRIIFMMGIPILVRRQLYIETPQRFRDWMCCISTKLDPCTYLKRCIVDSTTVALTRGWGGGCSMSTKLDSSGHATQ